MTGATVMRIRMLLERVLLGLCVCLVIGSAFGESALRTLTSADGVFRFKYSPALVVCQREAPKGAGELGEWACGPCNDIDSDWSTTACVVFPDERYKDKPAFSYGGFLVEEPKKEIAEKACLEAREGEQKQAQDKLIRGVTFKVFQADNASMSHSDEWTIYRTYHRNKCYALTIRTGWTKTDTFDPGSFKKFTEKDAREVERRLSEPVETFEFLK